MASAKMLDDLSGLAATIPEVLRDFPRWGARRLLAGGQFDLSFAEADAASKEMAARLLAAGVGKGTKVGILFPNRPEWIVSFLAITRIGGLAVPLSTFSPAGELDTVMHHTDVQALLVGSRGAGIDFCERLEQAIEGLAVSGPELRVSTHPFLRWIHVIGEDQPSWSSPLSSALDTTAVDAASDRVTPADQLVMINTSGTTSAPKSVIHTHGSLVRHSALLARQRGLGPEDRMYSPMPFFWVGGLATFLFYGFTAGVTVVTQERFEPAEALQLMERERVTITALWPNAEQSLVSHPSFGLTDLSSMRAGSLRAALPPPMQNVAGERYPGVFGMTETGGPHSSPDDPSRPLPEDLVGTFGRAVPGVERAIFDADGPEQLPRNEVGELAVRGPFVCDAIYGFERWQTFTADGWYRTGDRCSLDDAGYLRFFGRIRATVKSGGSNVSPAEVEMVLCAADGVRDAHVFGVPAGERGEDVAAIVVVEPDAVVTDDDLTARCRAKLSSFKVPRHWLVATAVNLPTLPSGKIDLRAAREMLQASPRQVRS